MTVIQIDMVALSVASQLRDMGIKAAHRHQESDLHFIDVNGMSIRVHREGDKVRFKGFAPNYPELHYMERPQLGETSASLEGFDAKRAARQVAARIIDPAQGPLELYKLKLETQRDRINALPAAIAQVRQLGFTVHEPKDANATEARLYLSSDKPGAFSGTAELKSDGGLAFSSLYLSPEIAHVLLTSLATFK